ncbi:RHS repeat-associated core domain-containing protein [Rhodomicrobium lacus]|uniref:RHS repeat-associated core domain-containing protein n=2 Tax=Rhodomicrobium lacus TaxID=2498452 RepID=UPI001AEC99AD|nr:RHS repeat-associated core domain-containing protein [Rhodomicrobium lacus]
MSWAAFINVPVALWQSGKIARGYTGSAQAARSAVAARNPQLDEVGLVHMNGRVYDPELGRFLSADPFIQDATNLQALNPYTYVQNNPLSFTDPSGYFLSGLFKAIGKVFSRVFKAIAHAIKTVLNSSIIRSLIQVAVCAATMATGPGICAATAGMMTMASGGSIVDAVKAFAFTLVSAGVWGGSDALGLGGGTFGSFSGGVGGMLSGVDPIAQLLVHGTVNGALTVAQGGDFLQGFATGAIGKAGGLLALESPLGSVSGEQGVFMRTVVAATAGGTAAIVTGGKFANGAVSAAFAHLSGMRKVTESQGPVIMAVRTSTRSRNLMWGILLQIIRV